MNRRNILLLAAYAVLAIAFYYIGTGKEITALFRGSGIAGFTFLAFSLLITPLAMFIPQLSRFVALRTDSGIAGAVLVLMHAVVLLLTRTHFNVYVLAAGAVALLIYIAMMLTSGAANMKKIGFDRWKMLHRLAYIALPLAAYHALTYYYSRLMGDPFGLVMAGMIGLAVIFQIAGFVKRKMKKS